MTVHPTPVGPPALPRPASTLVVLRDASRGDEVLLLKRHHHSGFMASAFVFPGGRVETEDGARWVGLLSDACHRLFPWVSPETATGFVVAAIRETFEEAGLLFARDAHGTLALGDRLDLAEGKSGGTHAALSLHAMLERRAARPNAEALSTIAWWVTPEAEPKRFDTRFFLARVPAGTPARIDAHEVVEHRWLTAEDALAAHAAGELRLAPPTFVVLEDLARGDVPRAQTDGAGPRTICPVMVVDGDKTIFALPGDRLHGDPRPAFATRTRVELLEGRLRSACVPRDG